MYSSPIFNGSTKLVVFTTAESSFGVCTIYSLQMFFEPTIPFEATIQVTAAKTGQRQNLPTLWHRINISNLRVNLRFKNSSIYIHIYIILPFCWLVNPHMTTLLIASSLCPPIHLKPSLSFYVPKTFSVSTPNLGLSVQIIYPGPGLPSLSRQGTVPLANVPEALGISSKQLVCSMSLAKVGVHPVVFREKLV